MEAATNFVPKWPTKTASAQLANRGLVVIPLLGAFVNLKTLNLSGNAIVRITCGALPRGLHVLNLAKNRMSAIEGLRELSHLRVLDLSYNRISQIGRGVASSSSLKELYLAGNPAQRNVGDEQLQKYLRSILPSLVYFSKETITANCSHENASSSSAQSLTISRQLDLRLRSEQKPIQKEMLADASTANTSSFSSLQLDHSIQSTVSSPKQSKQDQRRSHGALHYDMAFA
ncbi:hypothetical protein IFM89_031766 [Coptis chinensis]|uniref:Uncharacterized protein n=1 Tax=Coptis chinensis TaxID=261450 RepID=A0A835H1Q1_9MAGN|nr:hypothetical protein IFM89_031766 [Coptis chinensis]